MLRVATFCLALVGALVVREAAVRAAEPSLASVDFDSLVKKGDLARIARQWSLALKSYAAALEIRKDPLVSGRLGLVLIEFQEYDAAAGKLFSAIEKGAGANDAERTRFFQAYLVAKNQSCRLDVTIAQNGAKFEIDGEPWLDDRREFWTFVKPGKHQLRVRLEGFEDETREIDATQGGQIDLAFSLRLVKPPQGAETQSDSSHDSRAPEASPIHDKPAPPVVEDKRPLLTNSMPKNVSFVVGLGGGFVFGATPTPAVGPNVFFARRSSSWWELGIDMRVAWTFVSDKRFPATKFVTWSASITPCGRLQDRWFGCGIVGIYGMMSESHPKLAIQNGFGVRGGREFVLREPWRVQVWVDAILHPDPFEFLRPVSPWTGFIVTGALGARVIYGF